MAAQSEVEDALVALAAAALYPNGPGAPSSIGATARIYRGWPNAAALGADLAAGCVNVTVFPAGGGVRNTTRHLADWVPDPVMPNLTASVSGVTATFGGTADLGQVAGVLADGVAYVHRTIAGDTPALVAATLAAAIAPHRPATASGGSVSVPGAYQLVARTAADAANVQEIRRQEMAFRLTAWCPSPALRDAACDAIDGTLAATPFLDLPDGYAGRLRFASTATTDTKQDAAMFRRDLLYIVEFPTTQRVVEPSMLFGGLGLGAITLIA